MNTESPLSDPSNRQRLRLLEAAVEQSPVVIVITDPSGRIEYVNPKFCRLTGYTREEALGRHTRILNSGHQPAEFYASLWRTIQAGREWQGLFHNRRKDGTLFWESASLSPVRDESGKISHFIAIKEDVTERKAAEEELRRAREEAEAAVKAKDAFLANMSHELRTPLNAINGVAQTLLEGDCPAGMRPALELIAQAGADLLGLIQEVLCFSGLQAGKITLENKPFSLGTVLLHSLRFAREAARGKKIDLDYWVDAATEADYVGDGARLQQILVNIVGNAVKFTDKGRVHLGVRSQIVSERTSVLTFVLTDTGPGIPKEAQLKLFKPFTQGDDSITRRHGGTGLGLAISKSLAELMGGNITLKSLVGHGTSVRVSVVLNRAPHALPFAGGRRPGLLSGVVVDLHEPRHSQLEFRTRILESAGARVRQEANARPTLLDPEHVTVSRGEGSTQHLAYRSRSGTLDTPFTPLELIRAVQACLTSVAARPARPAVTSKSLRVLVADDVRTNRETLRLVLHHLGYDQVTLVQNGAEAVAEAVKDDYELFILDLHMPVMDGITATREIRQLTQDTDRRPAILALTASTLESDRERALHAGVDDFLTKPVMPAVLNASIQKLCGGGTTPPMGNLQPPAPKPVELHAVLDEQHLELIESAALEGGFAPLWRQMTVTFLQDIEGFRGGMLEACLHRRVEALYPLVHGIKGGALTVGWLRLGRRCQEVLEALRRDDFTAWDTWPLEMDRLIKEAELATKERMEKHLALSTP